MTLSEKIDTIRLISSQLLRPMPVPVTSEETDVISKHLDILVIEIDALLRNKKSLYHLAPRLLLRRWGLASFWMARRKIKQAQKSIIAGDQCFVHQAHFAALWAYQACDLFHMTDFLKKAVRSLDHYTLYTSHLEKGDVIVSYKTNKYLNFSFLSKIIAFSSNTHITHAFLVTDDDKPHHLVSSNPESKGLGLTTTSPLEGEMFIVLRYKSSVNGVSKEKILESLGTWWPEQESHIGKRTSFPELKSWIACFIGFIYVTTTYLFERPVCFRNPIKKQNSLFCSEFVEGVFKQEGVYLSPRSENPSVVGPVELFYSPYLEFKGIIFHSEDRMQLRQEILKTLTLFLSVGKEDVSAI